MDVCRCIKAYRKDTFCTFLVLVHFCPTIHFMPSSPGYPSRYEALPYTHQDDDDEESSLSEADLSDYVSGLNVGRTARGSGRFLRSSHTHSNVPAAYHPQRPPSAHTSHLPRPPGHQVARSQSASRLTMVRPRPPPAVQPLVPIDAQASHPTPLPKLLFPLPILPFVFFLIGLKATTVYNGKLSCALVVCTQIF